MSTQFDKLFVGATASMTRAVELGDVEAYAGLTGDANPVHLDDVFAARSRFGRRIAHGLLVAGYISAVLGTQLPGPGCIYLNQTLSFKAPVYPGDMITTTVAITKVREDKPIITLSTTCVNQEGRTLIEGEAVLLVPQPE